MDDVITAVQRARDPLSGQPLFHNLSDHELEMVARAAQLHHIEADQFFFFQDDPATAFYLLLQGRVRILQSTAEGHQVILRMIGPNEFFGGVTFLGDTRYPASAQALTPSTALVWNGETVEGLMKRHPQIALNLLPIIVRRLQELQERYRELATDRVERRVARTLLRLVRQAGRKVENGVLIDFPLSRQDLAEMAGTTLFSASRILSNWERQGIVQAGRQRILITAPHKLVAIAEDLEA
ncbi:Crp/Fnr family transcriptional regulator [Caldilinea sp.]|uniref:Crp/Fnr family transcriptional regulator n=1 Tax=Caldilinea sp. TaxID=2293560 RepID=UPI0021DC9464|nr:Crp/Fnr family transcriptional regulator [Caldilinea sp.]GIV68355.1 MAG: transcriptional regulator [Caldilinea sp.]